MSNLGKLTLFYDGSCHLCFREARYYKRKDKRGLIEIIDITAPGFQASAYGLDDKKVNLHMHSVNEQGEIFVGVGCFVEIWKRVPGHERKLQICENEYFRPVVDKLYDIFARHIRPRLPKRKCQDGGCAL